MGASMSSGSRGITIVRLAALSVVLIALYTFRDSLVPRRLAVQEYLHPSAPKPNAKPALEVEDAHDFFPASTTTVAASTTSHALSPFLAAAPAPARPDSAMSSSTLATPMVETTDDAPDDDCLHVPGADKLLVMLKTGATELYQKLPTHFITTLRCVPNFMIFSDLAQNFADIPVYDAIAPVSKKYKDEHEDFALYRRLRKYKSEGQDMSKLKGAGGWDLDKWKFMPMLHQAFESADDGIEWFVMIEADTSLSWNNLLLWLQTMDPREPLYLGAQNWIGDTAFAHGGSGIVVSRAAARKLEARRRAVGAPAYDAKWEEVTSRSCCGDEIVALAFREVDVPLTFAWPLMQGETVNTLDWTADHWCAPPITFHHVSPLEVDALYQFTMRWVYDHGWATPYLYRDLFAHVVAPHIAAAGNNRSDWNNLSRDDRFASDDARTDADLNYHELDDWQQAAVGSADACAAACRHEPACCQWMWLPGRCQLGHALRFGTGDAGDGPRFTSGWLPDRVDAFRRRMDGCVIRWSG